MVKDTNSERKWYLKGANGFNKNKQFPESRIFGWEMGQYNPQHECYNLTGCLEMFWIGQKKFD